MEKTLSPQERKKLQKIMMKALQNQIQALTPDLQYILTDDLVTALQNRLTVLQRIQKTTPYQK